MPLRVTLLRLSRAWKTTVSTNPATDGGYLSTPVARRLWGLVGGNYTAQLSSYATGENHDDQPMVHTELVPYAYSSLMLDTPSREGAVSVVSGDRPPDWSLVVAVKKESPHIQNLAAGSLCSLTVGSANPQVFRFFDQIHAKPWRSVLSGRAQEISPGPSYNAAWAEHFRRHKMLWAHAKAAHREASIRQGRLKVVKAARLSAAKTEEEENDDEADLAAKISSSDYTLFRFSPETGFLARPDGGLDRVTVVDLPAPDPLGPIVQPWITRLNFRREVLIRGATQQYSVSFRNLFAFHMDKRGLYVMGHAEKKKSGLESERFITGEETSLWEEYFLEWGPDMEFETHAQLAGWWQELISSTNLSEDSVVSVIDDDLVR